jgi:hypothetical protein
MDNLGGPLYPPTSEAEARKFFPGKDFTIIAKQEPGKDGETLATINVSFKDLNALLATPYGKTHALSVKVEKGVLTLKALTGAEGIARENFSSSVNETRFNLRGTTATRNLQIQGYSFGENGQPADGPFSLLIRFPQDLRHERVKFKLTGPDLM